MNLGVLQHHYMPVYDRSYMQNNIYAQLPLQQQQQQQQQPQLQQLTTINPRYQNIQTGNLINDIRNTFKTNEYFEHKELTKKNRLSTERIYFDINGVPISNKENKSFSDSSKKTSNGSSSKRNSVYSTHDYTSQYTNVPKSKSSKAREESISRSSRVLFTQSTPSINGIYDYYSRPKAKKTLNIRDSPPKPIVRKLVRSPSPKNPLEYIKSPKEIIDERRMSMEESRKEMKRRVLTRINHEQIITQTNDFTARSQPSPESKARTYKRIFQTETTQTVETLTNDYLYGDLPPKLRAENKNTLDKWLQYYLFFQFSLKLVDKLNEINKSIVEMVDKQFQTVTKFDVPNSEIPMYYKSIESLTESHLKSLEKFFETNKTNQIALSYYASSPTISSDEESPTPTRTELKNAQKTVIGLNIKEIRAKINKTRTGLAEIDWALKETENDVVLNQFLKENKISVEEEIGEKITNSNKSLAETIRNIHEIIARTKEAKTFSDSETQTISSSERSDDSDRLSLNKEGKPLVSALKKRVRFDNGRLNNYYFYKTETSEIAKIKQMQTQIQPQTQPQIQPQVQAQTQPQIPSDTSNTNDGANQSIWFNNLVNNVYSYKNYNGNANSQSQVENSSLNSSSTEQLYNSNSFGQSNDSMVTNSANVSLNNYNHISNYDYSFQNYSIKV